MGDFGELLGYTEGSLPSKYLGMWLEASFMAKLVRVSVQKRLETGMCLCVLFINLLYALLYYHGVRSK